MYYVHQPCGSSPIHCYGYVSSSLTQLALKQKLVESVIVTVMCPKSFTHHSRESPKDFLTETKAKMYCLNFEFDVCKRFSHTTGRP
jgi:hypothetical protein